MGIILNLFILSIGSIFGSIYLNKRYEEMLPMNVMAIIFILFIFYMLNIPLVGYYLIHLIGILLLIASAKKFFQDKDKRKEYLSNFFTPGLLIFGILSFIIYLITKDNYVMAFDELRLWALYPKSIFSTDKLMLGKNNFFSTEYFPGMPLFQYFFAKNYGAFVDSHLYLSYTIVCLSIFLPITKKINWKSYWAIIPTIILIYSFPMFFANSGFDMQYYYRSLFIDPALGMFFGYSLFLSTNNFKKDKFKFCLFCLSLSMVVLMKTVGLVLVACVLLSYFVNQLFIYKNFNLKFKRTNTKSYLLFFSPLLIVFFTFFSWQILTKPYVGEHYIQAPETIGSDDIKNAISLFFKPNKEQKAFSKYYVNHIYKTPILENNNEYMKLYTIPFFCLIFIIVNVFLFFSVSRDYRKIIISGCVFGLFSIILFLMFYFWVYVFTFNYNILCYGRYVSVLLSGISTFQLLNFFEISQHLKTKHLFYFLMSCVLTIYLYNFPKLSKNLYYENYKNDSISLSNAVLSNISKINISSKILTVYNHCDSYTYICSLYQHYLYLSLFDDNIYPVVEGMYVTSTSEPKFLSHINKENFNEKVTDFDYILIVEDIDNENKKDLSFISKDLKAGDFYKISSSIDSIIIEKIN